MKLFLGNDIKTGEQVFLNASGAHAILICGKRGSGKSYTLGVMVEELLASSDDIIPIVVDPMGVYHTMSRANSVQKDMLYKWGLAERSYRVRLLIPGEPVDLYGEDILKALKERDVEVIPLRLNPSDLTPDGWCDLFDANINRPMGIVLFRAVQSLQRSDEAFSIDEIIEGIELDSRAQDTSKEALINRLEAAKLWHVFAREGHTPIQDLFEPGAVNILDLSQLEPGARGRRNLAVSVIARNLFRARAHARLREEFGLAAPLPRVWMLIDEAHQFVPAGSTTLAKEQLVRWAKEGRQPGLSLVVASQQPSAIDDEILSQCDIILSHKLTTRADVSALNALSQDYMGSELRTYIKALERTGQAVIVDDERESVNMLRVRPRQSWHGGSTETPAEEEAFDIWSD